MKKIVVCGSYVTDLIGRAERLPIAGQTVFGQSFSSGAGGKGSNQAVAAHRAGADVTMLAKLGDDVFAQAARDFYVAEGMRTEGLMTAHDTETGIALILVEEQTAQNKIMVILGANGTFYDEDLVRAEPILANADYLLLQNEINADAVERLLYKAQMWGCRTVWNPAPARAVDVHLYQGVYCVTPNESEASELTGIEVIGAESAAQAAAWFFARGVQNVVITLGRQGVFASDGRIGRMVPALNVQAVDTTGAGDAFNGTFVTALAEGKDLFAAVEFGNAAAALSVTKLGTASAMPRREEIDNLLQKMYNEKHNKSELLRGIPYSLKERNIDI